MPSQVEILKGVSSCLLDWNEMETEENREELIKLIRPLANNVKMTRDIQMNAAQRLEVKESFLQGANIYYSCVTAFLSIYSINNSSKLLSMMSATITVILAISIAYFNAQHYKDRAQQFRNNSQLLYGLLLDMENTITDSTSNIDMNMVRRYQARYMDYLHNVENHSTMDFFEKRLLDQHLTNRRIKRENVNKPRKAREKRVYNLRLVEYIYYISLKISVFILKAGIIALPMLVVVIVVLHYIHQQ